MGSQRKLIQLNLLYVGIGLCNCFYLIFKCLSLTCLLNWISCFLFRIGDWNADSTMMIRCCNFGMLMSKCNSMFGTKICFTNSWLRRIKWWKISLIQIMIRRDGAQTVICNHFFFQLFNLSIPEKKIDYFFGFRYKY